MIATTSFLNTMQRLAFALCLCIEMGIIMGDLAMSHACADETKKTSFKETLRDRFWIFTCVAGADNDWLERAKFPQRSRMTPAEAAFYLDVPNLMMIQWEGKPAPPFDQYAIPLRPLKQVVWSLVGSGGETSDAARETVLQFAARMPNLSGFIMDDFFDDKGKGKMSLEQLDQLRRQLVIGGRRRDLYVVVYQSKLDMPIKPYLELFDKITYWTWQSKDLVDLERDFARLEKLISSRPKLLGCYFWDFGANQPMPLELMQHQCRLGLQWLRAGRIEGIVFLANTVADLDLAAVEWTRQWIAAVGDEPIFRQ